MVKDGQTGFLIAQHDGLALIEKLEELIIKQEVRLKMGLAGKSRYESNFTLVAFEKRFNNIINQIA